MKIELINMGAILPKNAKFEKWLETMVSEESDDHYWIGGQAIEKGDVSDLQVAFEAGYNSKQCNEL